MDEKGCGAGSDKSSPGSTQPRFSFSFATDKKRKIADHFLHEKEETVKKSKLEGSSPSGTSEDLLQNVHNGTPPASFPAFAHPLFNEGSLASGLIAEITKPLPLQDLGRLVQVSKQFYVWFSHPSVWAPRTDFLKQYNICIGSLRNPKLVVGEFTRMTNSLLLFKLSFKDNFTETQRCEWQKDGTRLYLEIEVLNISDRPTKLLPFSVPSWDYSTIFRPTDYYVYGLQFTLISKSKQWCFRKDIMTSTRSNDIRGSVEDFLELNPGQSLKNPEFCFKPDKTGYPQIAVAPPSIYESAKDENGITLERKCFDSARSPAKFFRVQLYCEIRGGEEYSLAQGKFLSTPVYIKFANPKK